MGLTITLEGEDGRKYEEIADSANVLHRVLPPANDPSSSVLRFIDWYGDTAFNQLQIPSFLSEWATLRPKVPEDRSLLDRVAALARRVEKDPHLYLKFYGD